LKGLGDGDAAANAAWTLNGDPELAKTVALTTPPKIIDATTTDPNMRLRVLFMRTILWSQAHNGLGIGCE
jgi:hypothetical protein